jgi:hypothetical protein
MLYTIPGSRRHLRRLSPFLRSADVAEIQAATGETPLDALTRSFDACYPCVETVMLNGVPVGMCGYRCVDNTDDVGEIWLVGTPAMTQNFRDFARASLDVFERFTRWFDVVTNVVDVRNVVHMRWLEWLGCAFGDTYYLGPEKRPFRRFFYSHVYSRSRRCRRPSDCLSVGRSLERGQGRQGPGQLSEPSLPERG